MTCCDIRGSPALRIRTWWRHRIFLAATGQQCPTYDLVGWWTYLHCLTKITICHLRHLLPHREFAMYPHKSVDSTTGLASTVKVGLTLMFWQSDFSPARHLNSQLACLGRS